MSWEAIIEASCRSRCASTRCHAACGAGIEPYDLAYRPVEVDGSWSKLVLVISDITDRLEAEKAEESQRETVAMFQRILRDPRGFSSFFDECIQLRRDGEGRGRRAHRRQAGAPYA